MVTIVDNNKIEYPVKELSFRDGYKHCSICMKETYNFVMIKDQVYCPGCAIEFLVEPYCLCGNFLRSPEELLSGICSSCK